MKIFALSCTCDCLQLLAFVAVEDMGFLGSNGVYLGFLIGNRWEGGYLVVRKWVTGEIEARIGQKGWGGMAVRECGFWVFWGLTLIAPPHTHTRSIPFPHRLPPLSHPITPQR